MRAFPSWFLRIECDRCSKVQMINEAHAQWHDRTLRHILARMRHDGRGGTAAKAELMTGIDGVSSPAGATHCAAGQLKVGASMLVRR